MAKPVYYSDYLQLDKILEAQQLKSELVGKPAHDEMLFIITHQTYELWFKQIVFELESIIDIFDDTVVEHKNMGVVIHRLSRIKTIQRVLIEQITIIETITPLDFLEFRDLLVPASGFQSLMFKRIEILLGIRRKNRIPADQEFHHSRLTGPDLKTLDDLEKQPTLLQLTNRWLDQMPFLEFNGFDFWKEYDQAIKKMLGSDKKIIEDNDTLTDREKEFQIADLQNTQNHFDSVLDEDKFNKAREADVYRFSHQGFRAALFINLYRDEPMLYTPFRYLTLLTDVDDLFTTWRQRHANMVRRMLGTKIGTGGSSGHSYLDATTQKNRVFLDLFNLSTFLLPRNELPKLPRELTKEINVFFSGQKV